MKDHRPRTTSSVQRKADSLGSVGKHTLAQKVQRRQAPAAASDAADVHEAAEQGISGPAGAMPHGAAIQAAFGSHDISGIQAHTDDNAAAGSAAMGAEAFATGNHVAFGGGTPSLHTAAHEAAHVVQQKEGVHLSGGVGAEGDAYERHADAVADAVVAGESAEGLLSAGPEGGGGGGGVQKKVVQKNPTPAPPPGQNAAPPQAGAQPAAPDPAEVARKTALKNFFSSAGPTIKGAGDFGTIAQAISPGVALYAADPTSAGDQPQEIQKRYANVHAGVNRARQYYQQQASATNDPKWTVAEQKFVTERLALALPEQANAVGDKMIAEGAKPAEAVSAGAVNLSNLEWGALMKHAGVVLAAENEDAPAATASADAVKADGGLAKVFSLKQCWQFMVPELKSIWTTVYQDEPTASAKFNELCKAQATIVHKPPQSDVDANTDAAALTGRLAPFAQITDSFAGGVTGFCGMASDYVLSSRSFGALKTALALNEGNYPGLVGIVVKIPADQLDAAMLKAQTTPNPRGGPATATNVLGKPSVFNSLMFSEFNYVCEDRTRGLTGGDGTNSGVPDPAGKAEVTVTNMPFSAFLSGGFEVFI